MKLGYFTMPLHPVGRDWRQTLHDAAVKSAFEKLSQSQGKLGEAIYSQGQTAGASAKKP